MFGRGIVITSLTAYLLVVGCIIWPTNAPAEKPAAVETLHTTAIGNKALTGLPYRGVAIQIQRVDWIDKYMASIDEIAAIGADTISLVIDTRQENGSSCRIWLDSRITPSDEQLARLIKHAKSKGMRVILMPIVLLDNPRNGEWRGTIKPENWDEWFDSYRAMIKHFASVAQWSKSDVLVVGSELVSTENNIEQWTQTINEVREIYKGQLTYSSNWDHYTAIGFWDQLDLIGMNSYWKLGDGPSVRVSEIERRWQNIQADLLEFHQKVKKPILFLEVGWCSLANAAHEPWDYTKTSEAVDLTLQKKLYEGFFNSWYGNPALGGFMIWEWPPGQGGPNNRGYIPKGKPAEAVLKLWMAKPRWKVE